jgi:hypothetical protein
MIVFLTTKKRTTTTGLTFDSFFIKYNFQLCSTSCFVPIDALFTKPTRKSHPRTPLFQPEKYAFPFSRSHPEEQHTPSPHGAMAHQTSSALLSAWVRPVSQIEITETSHGYIEYRRPQEQLVVNLRRSLFNSEALSAPYRSSEGLSASTIAHFFLQAKACPTARTTTIGTVLGPTVNKVAPRRYSSSSSSSTTPTVT